VFLSLAHSPPPLSLSLFLVTVNIYSSPSLPWYREEKKLSQSKRESPRRLTIRPAADSRTILRTTRFVYGRRVDWHNNKANYRETYYVRSVIPSMRVERREERRLKEPRICHAFESTSTNVALKDISKTKDGAGQCDLEFVCGRVYRKISLLSSRFLGQERSWHLTAWSVRDVKGYSEGRCAPRLRSPQINRRSI